MCKLNRKFDQDVSYNLVLFVTRTPPTKVGVARVGNKYRRTRYLDCEIYQQNAAKMYVKFCTQKWRKKENMQFELRAPAIFMAYGKIQNAESQKYETSRLSTAT